MLQLRSLGTQGILVAPFSEDPFQYLSRIYRSMER